MKRTKNPPKFLRAGKAAALLGVTTQTLRNWSRRGGLLANAAMQLPGARGEYRYDAAMVRDLVRKSQRGVA